MIASTSTGDDAVPDVDAPTPDIGAELEPPAGIEEPAMPVAALGVAGNFGPDLSEDAHGRPAVGGKDESLAVDP